MVTTRFAPSPTGYIHLGNCRTALFSYLWMLHEKHKNGGDGKFILRIEDTDKDRSKDEYVTELCRNLDDLGIKWDLGPDPDPTKEKVRSDAEKREYTQSLRTDIYEDHYNKLIGDGVAYKCFCSDAQLKMVRKRQLANGEPPRYSGTCRSLSAEEVASKEAAGEPAVLRFKVDPAAEIKFTDKVKGEQKFLGKNIGDFVIRKSGGDASFMFANAVDDALMGVDLVIRGDDHLSNTAYQIMILQQLGLQVPEYAHISLINGADGAPLSKRNGSQSIRDLLNGALEYDNDKDVESDVKGGLEIGRVKKDVIHGTYLPKGIINTLARLGCAYESEELMDMDDLAKNFNPDKLARSPARFDNKQLNHWQALASRQEFVETIAASNSGIVDKYKKIVIPHIIEEKNKYENISKQFMKGPIIVHEVYKHVDEPSTDARKEYKHMLNWLTKALKDDQEFDNTFLAAKKTYEELNKSSIEDKKLQSNLITHFIYKELLGDDLVEYVRNMKSWDANLDAVQYLRTIKDNVIVREDIDKRYTELFLKYSSNRLGADVNEKFYKYAIEVIKQDSEGSADNLRDSWKDIVKEIQEKSGKKGKDLFVPLRGALTGQKHGPPLDEFYALIGKDRAIDRLTQAASFLSTQ